MLTKRLAYEKWLGIKEEHQPATLYRLLAIDAFESDTEVIANADRQIGFVRQFQAGENANLAAKILNELSRARVILLNPQKKAAYDAKLREGSQRLKLLSQFLQFDSEQYANKQSYLPF